MSAAPDEVDDLATQLHQLVSKLSVQSRFHLETALRAASTPGVQGVLVIEVPSREAEQPLVKWIGGAKQLSLPL